MEEFKANHWEDKDGKLFFPVKVMSAVFKKYYLAKDYKNGGKLIEHTVLGTEFLRMFLMHVLPKGFVRIRHYP